MAEYKCECCNFFTKDKTKYNRHCLTLKHQKNNNNNTKGENDNTNLSISTTKTTIEKKEKIIMPFECKYCFKCFGTRQSRNRHQVKYCKYNERVPYEKLAEMLNEKLGEFGVCGWRFCLLVHIVRKLFLISPPPLKTSYAS